LRIKEFIGTKSYVGPEMLDAIDGLEVEVDEYKNDVHCLGIVFLYI
jgi:hypothetical protein